MKENIISIQNLSVYKKNSSMESAELVHNISFTLAKGEIMGIVGESGSGKTLTLKSLMGLLPAGIEWKAVERMVPDNMAMIFQNPMSALDPLYPVRKQMEEVLMVRKGLSRREAIEQTKIWFQRLSLPEELAVQNRYPSEISGGQCQRVLIAMALACDPQVLLCDEPTTALDVTVQKQVLDLIRELQKELGFAVIFVTHNLAVAAQICGKLLVMEKGRIVEYGPTVQVIREPQAEYTKKLLGAVMTIPRKKEAE